MKYFTLISIISMAPSTLRDLFQLTEEDAISKLQDFNIILSSKLCKKEHPMAVKRCGNTYFWRCSKRGCDEKISIRKDTWLDGTTLKYSTTLIFMYCWTKEYTSIKFCHDELAMGKNQTIDFNNYMREICASDLINNPVKIGGPGCSENFVDPHTGAHTQRVESMWNKAKNRNRRQWGTHRQMVDGYLCEFMWRQRHMNKDLLSVLLNCIANYDSKNKNIAP